MKKLPWLSLVILFAAYTTFSWFLIHTLAFVRCLPEEAAQPSRVFIDCLSQPTAAWLWGAVVVFTLLQALLLTTWFDRFKTFVGRWLKSDVGYFTLIIMGSISITMALVWLRTFGYILVLISAEILARLELQTAGFNRWQSLFFLTLFSLAGLAAGWSASLSPIFGQ